MGHTPETIEKMRKARKKAWTQGRYNNQKSMSEEERRTRSEQTKEGIKIGKRGRGETQAYSEANKKRWNDPKYRAQVGKAISKGKKGKKTNIDYNARSERFDWPEKIRITGNYKKMIGTLNLPTKPEQRIIKIIEQYHLSFKYNGLGDVEIAHRHPDFIHTENKPVVIEVLGRYWHDKTVNPNIDHMQTLEVMQVQYARHNISMIYMWDDGMAGMTDEEIHAHIITKLQEFEEHNKSRSQ